MKRRDFSESERCRSCSEHEVAAPAIAQKPRNQMASDGELAEGARYTSATAAANISASAWPKSPTTNSRSAVRAGEIVPACHGCSTPSPTAPSDGQRGAVFAGARTRLHFRHLAARSASTPVRISPGCSSAAAPRMLRPAEEYNAVGIPTSSTGAQDGRLFPQGDQEYR